MISFLLEVELLESTCCYAQEGKYVSKMYENDPSNKIMSDAVCLFDVGSNCGPLIYWHSIDRNIFIVYIYTAQEMSSI